MNQINWRHQYDFQRDAEEGRLAAYTPEGETLTQKQFAEDADLNIIAARFGLDGKQLPVLPLPGSYGDFSDAPDLREVMDRVHEAKEHFNGLPAKTRLRFNNDPRQLWDFINDPENADEAVRMGLLASRQEAPETRPDAATPDPEKTPPSEGVT